MADKISPGDWILHTPSGAEAQVLALFPDDRLGVDALQPTFYQVKDCKRKAASVLNRAQRDRAIKFYKSRGAIAGPWA